MKIPKTVQFLNKESENFYCVYPKTKELRINKNLIKLGLISLYIAEMYKGNKEKYFLYAILEQKTEVRPYRCKNFRESTFNKQFFSSKTKKGLFEQIEEANTNFIF